MAVLNDDINQLSRFLDNGANDILQLITTVVAVGGAMLLLDPGLCPAGHAADPGDSLGIPAVPAPAGTRYAEVRERAEISTTSLPTTLEAFSPSRATPLSSGRRSGSRSESLAYGRSNHRAIRISAGFIPLIRFAILFAFIAVLVVGGLQTWRGSLSLGAFSFLLFILQRLLWPLTTLGRTLDDYQRAMASSDRVVELLRAPITVVSGPSRSQRRWVAGSSSTTLSFAYPGRQPVIEALNLEIAQGETLGLVGSTGSGKSTLVKLLLRLYDPSSGTVSLDGVDLRELNQQDLRSAIGLVSQEPFLFHGTVATTSAMAVS